MLETKGRYVLERQLEAAYGRLPAILLFFPVVALAVWVPLRDRIPTNHMFMWMLVVGANGLVQWRLGRRFQRETSRDLERWALIRVCCAIVNGLCWGGVLGTLFFLPHDLVLSNFVIFVIGGISVVALASTSTHRPSLYAYEVANNVPVIVHLLLQGTNRHLAMAGLALGFLLAVLLIGHHMGKGAEDLIRAEASNRQLLDELTEAQAALRQANATLQLRVEERTAELQLALEEKQAQQQQLRQAERMEAVGRLAGGIAHDFNNVLTGIAGFAGMVHESMHESDPRREDLEEIIQATERASQLTKQLLGFAKGGITRPEVVDLGEHVRQIDKMLRRVLTANIELCWQLPEEPLNLFLDPGQLDQLVMNLVVNARDAMPNGGTIHVQATRSEPAEGTPACAVLKVSDTGTGIPEDLIEHIFEPFVTTKGDQGTGLGLATCFGIVKRAGGSIQVTSRPGRGATFEVHLPLSTQVVGVPSDRSPGTSTRPSRGTTVLVVEDQGAILKMVARALEAAGFSVFQAVSAEQALALVVTRGLQPDLVVSDVVLPHMSGIDLRDALRNHECHAKFLFMSGYIDEASLRRKDTGESVALLAKPFTIQQLVEATHEILRGAEADVVHETKQDLLN
jgi:signal transduction histidine kinase/ActR/RegA family two-component response regulator